MSCYVQVQMNTNQPSPVCLGLGDCSLVNKQKQCESEWKKRYIHGPTDMGMNSRQLLHDIISYQWEDDVLEILFQPQGGALFDKHS